jgi:hypothetical protein
VRVHPLRLLQLRPVQALEVRQQRLKLVDFPLVALVQLPPQLAAPPLHQLVRTVQLNHAVPGEPTRVQLVRG